MNRTYVALDLETTGLDPRHDTILEVGAVRFRTSFDNGLIQARVLDTWNTLVNPGRPIPIQIQQLTGISQQEVAHKPRFSQVMDNLALYGREEYRWFMSRMITDTMKEFLNGNDHYAARFKVRPDWVDTGVKSSKNLGSCHIIFGTL